MKINYTEKANLLLHDVKSSSKDEIINALIDLGEENTFIPVMIEVIKLAKAHKEYKSIQIIEECINEAYSPGLRSHILDDFISAKLDIQKEINDLKSKHNLYVLEQKLFMYKKAEEMLRSTSTTGATYAIMKILEFRGGNKTD